mmetsp:Transcript_59663/g.141967  ORF Transcript_59663/g.141967 Transcript_59663/m.141967 type:complete len:934 (+) Transcript_59663:112-2913(+)|eukprot:CAMPEP_0178436558 /NCGR_PEP_ID=MMETSP0689_2-20121128/34502_1 /TAXON_ID=160604 /ORGANISM="Amphidinium massartii, Strain CS-259" /LENGTH=933 /DNA_ID=CAMNT_0020058659 /DNA_START=10 /DNA_END=2811 /DNA_ORIENTATION=-
MSSASTGVWDTAWENWAADANCAGLDLQEEAEFNKIWISCATYGAVLLALITVPRYWCGDTDSSEGTEAATLVHRIKTWRANSQQSLGKGDPGSPSHRSAYEDDDPEPNVSKARQHLKDTTPHDEDGRRYGVVFSGRTTLRKVGGTGLDLYFIMLRHLGYVFCYMSIFSAPIIVFSYHGNFLPDIGSALARTTIGNLGYITKGGVEQEYRQVILGCQSKPLSDLTPIFGWLDFVALVIFAGFAIWLRFWCVPRAILKSDDQMTTVADFAVAVDCLPRKISDHPNYQEQLKTYIEEEVGKAREVMAGKNLPVPKAANKVQEVILVRNYNQRLASVKELAEMKKAKAIADYKGASASVQTGPCCCCKTSLEQAIADKETELGDILDENELPVLRAFVILNTPQDAQALLQRFRFSRTIFRCCGRSKFEGKAIRIQAAPEPSDILWANQDTPKCRRFGRRVIMLITWLIVLVLSVALVYLTEHSGRQLGPDAGSQVIGDDQSCDAGTKTSGTPCNALVAAEWDKTYARSLSGDDRNCFCTTQGYQEIVQDSELYDDLCKDWLIESGQTIATTFGTAMIIVVINYILRILVNIFAAWEKPLSISDLNSSVMFKVAVSQIINTSLIIFVINFNGFFLTKLFNMEGDYSDFDRGWYATVAAAILTNMVLNAFFAPLSSFSSWILAKIKRCCCCRRRAGHQLELLALYENPPFEIAERYAQMLTTVFCTVIYSSGLPLLNVFAVFYFFISYWSDRIILFRGSKSPPAYNLSMPLQASAMLLFAAPLHALLALFMYSHPCTFPSSAIGDYSFEGEEYASGGLKERVRRRSAWMMLLALVVLVALYVLWWLEWIIGGASRAFCRMCCACCWSGDEAKVAPETDEASELTWDIAKDYIQQVRPPATFDMCKHPEFEPLMKYMQQQGRRESREPEDLAKTQQSS